jgi:tetratricopeptide (TPR) repeat protein
LGWDYHKLKQYSNASKCYFKAIEIDPEFSTAYCNLCLLSFDTGKYSDGIPYGRKAIEAIRPTETNDNQAFPYNNLALCLWKIGQRDEAIHMLQRAVAIQPNNPLFKTNLSNIQNQSITSWGNVGKLLVIIFVIIIITMVVLVVFQK